MILSHATRLAKRLVKVTGEPHVIVFDAGMQYLVYSEKECNTREFTPVSTIRRQGKRRKNDA